MQNRCSTIFALSSGSLPAGIAVVRISGSEADNVLLALSGRLPDDRRMSLATLRDAAGEILDRAMVVRLAAPHTATGEAMVELHLHGGRATVAAVLACLSERDGCRPAQPGEFTRRAFENGRIDLLEAESLSDLLAAETQAQRRAAINASGGALGRQVEAWRERLLSVSAGIEAQLDFADEDDVDDAFDWMAAADGLGRDIRMALERPPAERLKDGLRVVVAGPPNAGKSSLLNALVGRDAAIVSDVAGTTRDVIEASTSHDGLAFVFQDTAGLRESDDAVERIGIARARLVTAAADVLIWTGDTRPTYDIPTIWVRTKADLPGLAAGQELEVSSTTGAGIEALVRRLVAMARTLLPRDDEIALNERHRQHLWAVVSELSGLGEVQEPLLAAEHLRMARHRLGSIDGRTGTEEMLDVLFGSFCIGK